MEVSFFERRKILKNMSLLDLTPFTKVGHEVDENGLVTILYPKFKNAKVSKYMLGRKTPFIHLKLDELGSATWIRIDGKNQVNDICNELEATLGEKVQPVHARVGKFLSHLYSNKYISFQEILKKEK
ncbi:MAG: PqqD family protein [Bacteroidetes bacterium]|nr:PqqD family protein [Bacteroidota bacterium]